MGTAKTYRSLLGDSNFDRYAFVILAAIELLMSFTFLGYIHIPPISVTIAFFPVLIAGCLFTPLHAVIVGFLFGMASMYKASASYVMPADAVFSPFLSGNPFGSFCLSVGTRTLFGLVVGLAFMLAKNKKFYPLWIGVISAFAPRIHSLLVYTAMGIFFPELGYHYTSALRWRLGDTLFAIFSITIVVSLRAVYQSEMVQNIKFCVDQSFDDPYASSKITLSFAVFNFAVLFIAVLATIYFSQRASYMLEQHGVVISKAIFADLLLLQIQFLIAFLSLSVISIMILVSMYKYMAYRKYAGEIDELTGVMGRRMFLYYCEKAQKTGRTTAKQAGWFLFVDADYFKEINDTFGHSVGDQVLKSVALNLQVIVGADGAVGRIGGDEFAVIIEKALSQTELERRLDHFLTAVAQTLPDRTVSCSIGAYQFIFPQSIQHLLTETDDVLYIAKANGRACYAVKACVDV